MCDGITFRSNEVEAEQNHWIMKIEVKYTLFIHKYQFSFINNACEWRNLLCSEITFFYDAMRHAVQSKFATLSLGNEKLQTYLWLEECNRSDFKYEYISRDKVAWTACYISRILRAIIRLYFSVLIFYCISFLFLAYFSLIKLL